MPQIYLLYAFLALGVAWAIVWLYVVLNVSRTAPEPVVEEKTDRLRQRLVFPLGATLLILLAVSIYFMPYPDARARTIGDPTFSVHVDALQWAWIVDKQEIPVDTVIAFDVTSQDVNHGFAIYDPNGDLVTQVQAMPDYTNKLIWRFDEPGEYTIRCLEYCGIGHHMMLAKLVVV
jgi:cytochrome c oxidase subunit 2